MVLNIEWNKELFVVIKKMFQCVIALCLGVIILQDFFFYDLAPILA